jgi:hypothetical protein
MKTAVLNSIIENIDGSINNEFKLTVGYTLEMLPYDEDSSEHFQEVSINSITHDYGQGEINVSYLLEPTEIQRIKDYLVK